MRDTDEFTAEQLAAIRRISDSWEEIALSTEPVDPVQVVQAVHKLYRAVKINQLQSVVVLPSPLACALAAEFMQQIKWEIFADASSTPVVDAFRVWIEQRFREPNFDDEDVWDMWRDMTPNAVDRLLSEIKPSLPVLLWEQMRNQPPRSPAAQEVGGLWVCPADHFDDPVYGMRSKVHSTIGRFKLAELHRIVDGPKAAAARRIIRQAQDDSQDMLESRALRDAKWWDCRSTLSEISALAFLEAAVCLGTEFGEEDSNFLDAAAGFARTGGALFPMVEVAFVSDRPCLIEASLPGNDQTNGCQVGYRDGWSVVSP